MVLSHRDKDYFLQVEYDCERVEVRRSSMAVSTNHSVFALDTGCIPEHSRLRMLRLGELMEQCNGVEDAQAALRDQFDLAHQRETRHATMNTVRRVDNIYSSVLMPRAGEVWWSFERGGQVKAERLRIEKPNEQHRHVLRMVEATAAVAGEVVGAVYVSGTGAIAKRLRQLLGNEEERPKHWILADCCDSLEGLAALVEECKERIAGLESITAVTSLGGDFGLSGSVGNVFGGGLAGLVKSLGKEFPALRIRIIDAPPDADTVLRELSAADMEVGYREGVRRVLRCVPERAVGRRGEAGGVWVVTGGARGITALCALAMAKRYGLKLHILGLAAERDLAQYAAAGISAAYHCCDAANRERVERVLERIRSSGPIRGVLHGAGYEASMSLSRKTVEGVRRTLESKVLGARNLMELTAQDPLSHFLTFGSLSGRFGAPGQADYCMASELLAKEVQRYRAQRPEVAATVFEWPAWDTAGMAMRPEARFVLAAAGHTILRAEEGVRHLLAELEAGCPEAEVVIAAGSEVVSVTLDRERDEFLRDHTWRGHSVVPAAVGISLMLDAAKRGLPAQGPIVLRDFAVENLLRVAGNRVAVQVKAESAESGLRCTIVSDFYDSQGRLVSKERRFASGSVGLANDKCETEWPAARDPEWQTIRYPEAAEAQAKDHVHFGLSMRCLEESAEMPDGVAGRLRAGATWIPTIDACFVACGIYCMEHLKTVVLVQGVAEMRIWRQPEPGEMCLLRAVWRGPSHIFDFVLTDEDGAHILEARGCLMVSPGGRASA
jgi:hypothetical protein